LGIPSNTEFEVATHFSAPQGTTSEKLQLLALDSTSWWYWTAQTNTC